ncbi:MAG: ABC transporter ATP-binding protein [Bacteroidetes bacterium]|nr:MAG: ABC transporter ATP-binding protein [Bacteroidota bacterium]
MSNDNLPLLRAEGVSKKFCKDIKYNMLYGMQDLLLPGYSRRHYSKLRTSEFWVLKDVSFDIKPGEIIGVVGSNGSGKTSLMRVLAGIYTNDLGEIYRAPDLRVTSVFAIQAGLQPYYTGAENVYLKGALYGLDRAYLRERMEFVREFSELGDSLDKPFGNYSSGMRARLAYAIAIATDPDLFILDEALAVGDAVFKAKCYEHLKEFARQPNKGVLFVSNNARKTLHVASRVIVMNKGRVIFDSTDVRQALVYYIENCLQHLDEVKRKTQLERVLHYDL